MWCVESAEQDFIDLMLPFISWNILHILQRKHEEQDSDSVCTDFLNDAVSFHWDFTSLSTNQQNKAQSCGAPETPMLKRYLCNFTQQILSCKTSEIKDKQRFQPCDLEKCRWNYKTWLTKHEGSKINSSNQVLFKFIHSNALKWMKI